jgi:hypothetical protein
MRGKPDPARITIKFGLQHWKDIPMAEAINVVETYVKTEQAACDNLVKKINEEHWIASFWSEVLGGKKPPAYSEWIAPLARLGSARSALLAGNLEMVEFHLHTAVRQYNWVHSEWIRYRQGLEKGGSRAITIMEITNMVLGSAIAGGVGGRVVSLAGRTVTASGRVVSIGARTVVKGAATSAGLTGYTELSKGLGLIAYKVEKSLDIGNIALAMGVSFVASLTGGALSQKFIAAAEKKAWDGYMGQSLKEYMKMKFRWNIVPYNPSAPTQAQKFLTHFFSRAGSNLLLNAVLAAAAEAKGKNMPVGDFLLLILEKIPKNVLSAGVKAFTLTYQ